jgi:prophage endopeptidase
MTITPMRFVFALLLVALIPLFWFVQVVKDREGIRSELLQAQTEVIGLREAARINGEQLAARDQVDQKNTEELNHVRAENEALRRNVDDGHQRLPVRATCKPAVPTTATGAAGVADASTAELAADARPDYFTLRDQLALSRQMILGLQDYTRQVCLRMPAKP